MRMSHEEERANRARTRNQRERAPPHWLNPFGSVNSRNSLNKSPSAARTGESSGSCDIKNVQRNSSSPTGNETMISSWCGCAVSVCLANSGGISNSRSWRGILKSAGSHRPPSTVITSPQILPSRQTWTIQCGEGLGESLRRSPLCSTWRYAIRSHRTVCLARSPPTNGLFLWSRCSHAPILTERQCLVNRIISAESAER